MKSNIQTLKKRFVLCVWASLLLSAVMPLTLHAQDAQPTYYLCVWLTNGERVGYPTTDNPMFSNDGSVIHLTSSLVDRYISPEELDRFTLEPMNPDAQLRFFVWLRDGSHFGYPIEEYPEVYLGAETFTLNTTKTTMEFPSDQVVKFTLEDADSEEPTEVSEAELQQAELHLRQGNATISHLKPGSEVRIVDTAGRVIDCATADGEGFAVVPMSSLPRGIYIIKTEQITYKIQKK